MFRRLVYTFILLNIVLFVSALCNAIDKLENLDIINASPRGIMDYDYKFIWWSRKPVSEITRKWIYVTPPTLQTTSKPSEATEFNPLTHFTLNPEQAMAIAKVMVAPWTLNNTVVQYTKDFFGSNRTDLHDTVRKWILKYIEKLRVDSKTKEVIPDGKAILNMMITTTSKPHTETSYMYKERLRIRDRMQPKVESSTGVNFEAMTGFDVNPDILESLKNPLPPEYLFVIDSLKKGRVKIPDYVLNYFDKIPNGINFSDLINVVGRQEGGKYTASTFDKFLKATRLKPEQINLMFKAIQDYKHERDLSVYGGKQFEEDFLKGNIKIIGKTGTISPEISVSSQTQEKVLTTDKSIHDRTTMFGGIPYAQPPKSFIDGEDVVTTTTTINPIIFQVYHNMDTKGLGYLTGFLIKLFQLIATKEKEHVRSLCFALEREFAHWDRQGLLLELDTPLLPALRNSIQMFNIMPEDNLQARAILGYQLLSVTYNTLSQEVKDVFSILESFFDPEKGMKLLQSLVEIHDFPNHNKSAKIIAENVVKSVLSPILKSPNSGRRLQLIQTINHLLVTKYNYRRHEDNYLSGNSTKSYNKTLIGVTDIDKKLLNTVNNISDLDDKTILNRNTKQNGNGTSTSKMKRFDKQNADFLYHNNGDDSIRRKYNNNHSKNIKKHIVNVSHVYNRKHKNRDLRKYESNSDVFYNHSNDFYKHRNIRNDYLSAQKGIKVFNKARIININV